MYLEFLKYAAGRLTEQQAQRLLCDSDLAFRVGAVWAKFSDNPDDGNQLVTRDGSLVGGASIGNVTGIVFTDDPQFDPDRASITGERPLNPPIGGTNSPIGGTNPPVGGTNPLADKINPPQVGLTGAPIVLPDAMSINNSTNPTPAGPAGATNPTPATINPTPTPNVIPTKLV